MLSILGLLILVYRNIRQGKLDQQAKVLVFLAYVAAAYFLSITIFDWFFIRGHGFSFGIQGRYFFPTIIAHLSLVLVGLITLAPKSYKKWVVAILTIAVIVFNYFSLFWVASHYYSTSPINIFIIQASQYKPEIYKDFGLIFTLLLSIASIIFFLYKYSRILIKTNANNFP